MGGGEAPNVRAGREVRGHVKQRQHRGPLGQLLIEWQRLRRMLSQAQVKQEGVPNSTNHTCHRQSVSKEEQANLLHATPPAVILSKPTVVHEGSTPTGQN